LSSVTLVQTRAALSRTRLVHLPNGADEEATLHPLGDAVFASETLAR
jgi:hypothetical protein